MMKNRMKLTDYFKHCTTELQHLIRNDSIDVAGGGRELGPDGVLKFKYIDFSGTTITVTVEEKEAEPCTDN